MGIQGERRVGQFGPGISGEIPPSYPLFQGQRICFFLGCQTTRVALFRKKSASIRDLFRENLPSDRPDHLVAGLTSTRGVRSFRITQASAPFAAFSRGWTGGADGCKCEVHCRTTAVTLLQVVGVLGPLWTCFLHDFLGPRALWSTEFLLKIAETCWDQERHRMTT